MSNATPNNPTVGSPAQRRQSTEERPDCEAVLDRLGTVVDPRFGDDIVSLGLVDRVRISEELIEVELGLYAPHAPEEGFLVRAVHDALEGFEAEIVTLATGPPSDRPGGVSMAAGPDTTAIPGVRNVVPFVGTDPGAGTTTTALNAAVALARRGARVGLLQLDPGSEDLYRWINRRTDRDSDGDGEPVAASMVGRDPVPPAVRGVRVLCPETYRRGTGDRLPDGSADVMVKRLCFDVGWGGLDYLVVDVPAAPTGIGQAFFDRVDTAGVVVTTPYETAGSSLRRRLERIRGAGTTPLGIVETPVGTTIAEARQASAPEPDRTARSRPVTPLLGTVPWTPELSEAGEQRSIGPDHDLTAEFDDVAANVADAVGAIQRREHSIRRLTTTGGDPVVACQIF